jgi:hypothetical protein
MTIKSGSGVRRSWFSVALLFALSVAPGFNRALQAAPPIPVTTCGQDLTVAGGNYILKNDLSCNGDADCSPTFTYTAPAPIPLEMGEHHNRSAP